MFQKAQIAAIDRMEWDRCEAAVYFWVRKSSMEANMDRLLLDALRSWLDDDWTLAGHVFVTNEQFPQQAQLLDAAGLQIRFEIKEEGKPGTFLAYA